MAIGLVGCSFSDPEGRIHFSYSDDSFDSFEASIETQLIALESSDPVADAESAYHRGDHRVIAVSGIALIAPGIRLSPSDRLYNPMQSLDFKIISFTSDHLRDEVHRRMNAAAGKYARDYNVHMILMLVNQGKIPNQSPQTMSLTRHF